MASEALVPQAAPELPDAVARRGVSEAQWRTLANNLYPGAHPQSVLMVIDYCAARKLDPLKKPCHIVPMRVKDAKSGDWGWRDVVMPGIYEYRITAQRTGLYLGHTEPEYGDAVEHLGVTAPEWCAMTFHRWNAEARVSVPFPVRVFFREVVGTSEDKKTGKITVNARWTKAPIQMLTKCAEAAGLREAFPEEFGGEPTAEEMDGQRVTIEVDEPRPLAPQPAQRKSQQPSTSPAADAPKAEEPKPAAPAKPVEPEPPAAATGDAPNVGVILEVLDVQGAALLKLNTGFQAGTRNTEMITAAKNLKATGRLVELVTRPSKKGADYAAILEAIEPVGDGK